MGKSEPSELFEPPVRQTHNTIIMIINTKIAAPMIISIFLRLKNDSCPSKSSALFRGTLPPLSSADFISIIFYKIKAAGIIIIILIKNKNNSFNKSLLFIFLKYGIN